MLALIKYFFKASFRDKTFLFFDWIFPVALITAIAIFTRGKSYSTFFLPSLMAFLLLQNLIYAIPYRIAQFRENSVLHIIAEEGNITLFTMAFLITRVILVALQGALFLPIGILILKPAIEIKPEWVFFAFVFSLFAIGGFSMLIAVFAKNANSAYGLAQLFYISLSALSGIFYPLESYPKILRVIGEILPLSSSRSLMEYALLSGGEVPLKECIYLFVFGIVTLFIGAILFKRVLNSRYKVVDVIPN
ncbi:MAG: ABC transporter permease [Herbinix sp.]|nr:ABC transporter permease [Herbinix sp.]